MVYFLTEINCSWNYPQERHSIYTTAHFLSCICSDYSGNFSIGASLSELILSMRKGELDSCIPFLKE